MTDLFTGLSGVTSGIFDMVGDVTAAMIANPVLLVGFGLSLVGLAIGLVKKFM